MAEILNSTINRKSLKTKNIDFDLSFDDTFYIENSEFLINSLSSVILKISIHRKIKNIENY